MSCGGRNLPDNAPQNTTIICHLSPIPTSYLHSFKSIVDDEPGMVLMPVWSQLKTNWGGISSISTTALTSMMNCSFSYSFKNLPLSASQMSYLFSSQNSSCTDRSDLAQLLVIVAGPLFFFPRRVLSAFQTMAITATIVMDVVTTPPPSCTAWM